MSERIDGLCCKILMIVTHKIDAAVSKKLMGSPGCKRAGPSCKEHRERSLAVSLPSSQPWISIRAKVKLS
jgi:hypothetical protein